MKKSLLLTIFLICFNPYYALSENYDKKFAKEIKNIDPNINIGIKIRNLATNKVIYQQNSDRYYNFASSLKLITIAGLHQYFGDNHHYISRILRAGPDYYLDINSPDFSYSDLDSLIASLKEKDPNEIAENFYIINSTFSLPPIIDSRMISDTKYCYGALITKVHINGNCVRLKISPSKKTKNKIAITHKELVPYNIINNAITIAKNYQDKITTNIQGNSFIINGTLSQGYKDLTITAVTNDNLEHIKLMLQNILNKYNIQITGEILYGVKPDNYEEVTKITKDFEQIATIALKNSDNFITDYLLAEFGNKYGINDWAKAASLLKRYISEQFKIDLTDSVIVDGSGLSRYNMLTVEQFDKFLYSLYNHQNFQSVKSMMACPNKDGTLSERCHKLNIFAKTGIMSGISSLVGYIYDKNNIAYSFVIVSNNYIGGKKKYAELEEKIIRAILAE